VTCSHCGADARGGRTYDTDLLCPACFETETARDAVTLPSPVAEQAG
jgi:hypothetical protein